MGYKTLLHTIKGKTEKYKGSLYFGVGTLKELNSDDSRNFPLAWIQQPITKSTVVNSNGIIVQETFSFTLKVVQSASLQTDQKDIDQYYDDTNKILVALLNDLLKNDYQLVVGTASQVFRKSDMCLVGWDQPLQVVTNTDLDLCCELFDEDCQ